MVAIGATMLWTLFVLIPPFSVKVPVITLPYVRLPVLTLPSIHIKLPTVRLFAFKLLDPSQFRIQALVTDARGLLAFFLLGIVSNVRNALSVVKEEQKRTTAERDAFDQFARAVAATEPTVESTSDHSLGSTLLVESKRGRDDLQSIRRSFRETVMAVPHYEMEYDESLATHMGMEFGEELAVAVHDGDHLTPQVQRSLYEASIEARDRRDRFRSQLEEERSALTEAKRTIKRIEEPLTDVEEPWLITRSFDDLAATHDRLERARDACERLLSDRQRQRRDGHAGRVRSPALADLQSYLYASLDVRYPVLSDVTRLLEQVQQTQRLVRHELTRRV